MPESKLERPPSEMMPKKRRPDLVWKATGCLFLAMSGVVWQGDDNTIKTIFCLVLLGAGMACFAWENPN